MYSCVLSAGSESLISRISISFPFGRVCLYLFNSMASPSKFLPFLYAMVYWSSFKRRPLRYTFFETLELPVPGDYDNYLTLLYCDFMKLPSESEIQVHSSRVTFIE